MLVLSRKEGERIVIDGKIEICINRIAGNRVSVGIQAPKEMSILRGEIKKARDEFGPPKEEEAPSHPFELEGSWEIPNATLP